MTLKEYKDIHAIESQTRDTVMLSILMPTIPERAKMFRKLKLQLLKQVRKTRNVHPVLGMVEVIEDDSKKFKDGGLDIGSKRQALLDKATGMYVCFLDDDESISPDYVESLLRLCFQRPDVCTFSNISKLDNFWCLVKMSIKYNENQQAFPGVVLRKPWHICPVLREHAQKVKFPVSNYGEDWVWFEKVLEHCKTEANTSAILHQYNHSIKVSQSDNVTTAIG
jgi:hypothetical protein